MVSILRQILAPVTKIPKSQFSNYWSDGINFTTNSGSNHRNHKMSISKISVKCYHFHDKFWLLPRKSQNLNSQNIDQIISISPHILALITRMTFLKISLRFSEFYDKFGFNQAIQKISIVQISVRLYQFYDKFWL